MHLKVVRHIHTGTNTLHVSMKSTFLQDLQEGMLRLLRIKFGGNEKDGFRAVDQQTASDG